MTDKQVLQQCIDMIWESDDYIWPQSYDIDDWEVKKDNHGEYPNSKLYVEFIHYKATLLKLSADDIVFDHDFAKALFGEERKLTDDLADLCEDCYPDGCDRHWIPAWKYHLQQLALSEDRIDYLRDWIKNQPKEE